MNIAQELHTREMVHKRLKMEWTRKTHITVVEYSERPDIRIGRTPILGWVSSPNLFLYFREQLYLSDIFIKNLKKIRHGKDAAMTSLAVDIKNYVITKSAEVLDAIGDYISSNWEKVAVKAISWTSIGKIISHFENLTNEQIEDWAAAELRDYRGRKEEIDLRAEMLKKMVPSVIIPCYTSFSKSTCEICSTMEHWGASEVCVSSHTIYTATKPRSFAAIIPCSGVNLHQSDRVLQSFPFRCNYNVSSERMSKPVLFNVFKEDEEDADPHDFTLAECFEIAEKLAEQNPSKYYGFHLIQQFNHLHFHEYSPEYHFEIEGERFNQVDVYILTDVIDMIMWMDRGTHKTILDIPLPVWRANGTTVASIDVLCSARS
jgi:hypothetical protein